MFHGEGTEPVVAVEVLIIAGAVVLSVGLTAVALLRSKRGRARTDAPSKACWSPNNIAYGNDRPRCKRRDGGLVLSDGNAQDPQPERQRASAAAVAALIRQGPFTGALPDGLKRGSITDVSISAPSSAHRIDAGQLQAEPAGALIDSFFSHLEVYSSGRVATARARARVEEIKRLHGTGRLVGTEASYCAYLKGAGGSWECGGSSGLVYAEASVSPAANAHRRYASGTVSRPVEI